MSAFAMIRIPVRAVRLHANMLHEHVGTQVWHSATEDGTVVTGPYHVVDNGNRLLLDDGTKVKTEERRLGYFWKPLGAQRTVE